MSDKASQAADTAASTVKVGAAWASYGASTAAPIDWQQIAAFMATMYTAYVFDMALWRHWVRPYAESRGWVKRRPVAEKIIQAIEEIDQ